jgi:hypothetical protein
MREVEMLTRMMVAITMALVLAACGGRDTSRRRDSGPTADDGGGGGGADTGSTIRPPDGGDLTMGPLTIEIFDPLDGQTLTMTPVPDLPDYYEARYPVRARIRGVGADAVTELVAQSSGPGALYYYSPVEDGPDGRVATMTMRVGGIYHAGDATDYVGIRVTQGTPPGAAMDEIAVTVQPPP